MSSSPNKLFQNYFWVKTKSSRLRNSAGFIFFITELSSTHDVKVIATQENKCFGQSFETYPADCRKIAAVDSNMHDWD